MKKTSTLAQTKKTILVTGGGGYVGSVLINKLVNLGFNIRVVDKFYFGIEPIEKFKDKIDIRKADIRKLSADIFKNVTAVIHLAGLSNDPTAEFNPKANLEINTEASKEIAMKAKQAGVERFIFASSCSVYDLGEDIDLKSEVSFVNPQAAYSISKFKAEKELLKLKNNNFCVTILRKGTIGGFSPRMRFDLVVNSMVKNALTTKTINVFSSNRQWRPLVDINDVADAYMKTLTGETNKINGEIFNISLDNFLIKDLAEITAKTLKKYFKLNTRIIVENKDQRNRSYRVSNLKSEKLLGFKASKKIDQSIIELVDNLRLNNIVNFDHPIYYNITWMKPIFQKEQKKRK